MAIGYVCCKIRVYKPIDLLILQWVRLPGGLQPRLVLTYLRGMVSITV